MVEEEGVRERVGEGDTPRVTEGVREKLPVGEEVEEGQLVMD
jgi:hypothetical protein